MRRMFFHLGGGAEFFSRGQRGGGKNFYVCKGGGPEKIGNQPSHTDGLLFQPERDMDKTFTNMLQMFPRWPPGGVVKLSGGVIRGLPLTFHVILSQN